MRCLNKMENVWILPIEPLETRYTGQLHKHLPAQLANEAALRKRNITIYSVDGEIVSNKPSPGAFLDFAATNIWKSTQLAEFMKRIQNGQVKQDDYVLVTDAWNTSILQIKYTSDLLGLDLKIGAIWHAGAYDPNDFLGRATSHGKATKKWVNHTELALLNAIDHNYFATQKHIDLINKTYFYPPWQEYFDFIRTGFPFEFFEETFAPHRGKKKKDMILFPHRLAEEKQLNIFQDLAKNITEFQWVICQESQLSKIQYHRLLEESKFVFSANLQETLGISMMEGVYCNSWPLAPNRLTYTEMYNPNFLYPSEYTESWDSYIEHKEEFIAFIRQMFKLREDHSEQVYIALDNAKQYLSEHYLSGKIMYNTIFNIGEE